MEFPEFMKSINVGLFGLGVENKRLIHKTGDPIVFHGNGKIVPRIGNFFIQHFFLQDKPTERLFTMISQLSLFDSL